MEANSAGDIRDTVRVVYEAVSDELEDETVSNAIRLIKYMSSYIVPSVSFISASIFNTLCQHIDGIVDGILAIARTTISAAGLGKVIIPEMCKDYNTLYGYITACYKIVGGYCKDLASIHRRSHIIVEPRENGEYYAEGAFGMDVLELGFAEFLCKLMGFGPCGSFKSNVGENSIKIGFTLSSRRGYLNPYIEEICFERFSKVTYNITGFWFLNTIIEKILEFFTPLIWGAYVKTLETGLENAMREVLDERLAETQMLEK
ncbi:hypothetical protein L9F63_021147 [Diploptera punctata]|uniref:Uncharacterized protein n=1 Tax=Diploptera punctata TaxID=6984 RepID=A0AAD7ZQZ9_DIPPU|nr:hypothetical protein L9F63_021147 [Diploptera punctata]